MNLKKVFSAIFFSILAFFVAKDVTCFDLMGVSSLSTENSDNPQPNIIDPLPRKT